MGSRTRSACCRVQGHWSPKHDPEKLQTFWMRSCATSKTSERYPIRSDRMALQGIVQAEGLRAGLEGGNSYYSALPPICLSLANTASTLSSSLGFFSSGSG